MIQTRSSISDVPDVEEAWVAKFPTRAAYTFFTADRSFFVLTERIDLGEDDIAKIASDLVQ
jgi:hypothetical protein